MIITKLDLVVRSLRSDSLNGFSVGLKQLNERLMSLTCWARHVYETWRSNSLSRSRFRLAFKWADV